MHYLPKDKLNYDPVINPNEQYTLVRVIEGFKERLDNVIEAKGKKKVPSAESEAPAGDEITSAELDFLMGILSDIEARKRPITRIAYLKALNILEQDIKHLPILKNIFKAKGIEKDAAMPIEKILSDSTSNHVQQLIDYIRGDNQVSATELANSDTPKNVGELFPGLHPDLVTNLFNTSMPTGGGKQSGKGELGLILLLKGAKLPQAGDVEVPEGIIEVKQGEGVGLHPGRLTSAKKGVYGNAVPKFIESFSNIFARGGPEVVALSKDTNWYNLGVKNCKLFGQMLQASIQNSNNQITREVIVKAYQDSIKTYLNNFKDVSLLESTIDSGFDTQGLPIQEALANGLFKLSFMHYLQNEHFNYFAVYKDNELFFKSASDTLNTIGTPGGLQYASTPSFEDSRGYTFAVTF